MPRVGWGGPIYLRSRPFVPRRRTLVCVTYSSVLRSLFLYGNPTPIHVVCRPSTRVSYSQTSNTTCPLKCPSKTRVRKSPSRKALRSRLSLSPLKNQLPLPWETSPSSGQPSQVHAPASKSHIGFSWGPMVNAFDGPVDPGTTRTENILPTTVRPLRSIIMTPLAQSKVAPPSLHQSSE